MGKHHSNADLCASFSQWMSQQRYTSRTQVLYNRLVQEFCRFIGPKRRLKTVRPLDINDFLSGSLSIQGDHAKARPRLTALRCFFGFLYVSGAVDTVAPWFVRIRRPVFRLPVVLTEREVLQLIRAAKGLRNKAILELFYATGCRLSEVAKMKVEDINFERRRIRVYAKRKYRAVYFGNAADLALRRYLRDRAAGPLFLDNFPDQRGHLACTPSGWEVHWRRYPERKSASIRVGALPNMSRREATVRMHELLKNVNLRRPHAPLGGSGIEKVVRFAGRQAGIRHIVGPQMLRHTFATHMLQRGADIRVIQELLGHTWITSTQRYTHLSTKKAKADYMRYHPRAGHALVGKEGRPTT